MEKEFCRQELQQKKAESVIQVLFKVSRLLNGRALEMANEGRAQGEHFRASHTSLLPHIDLEGTRLTVLAERMAVSKQAVGQIVQELEDRGIVERRPDPSDGRAKLICFTEAGKVSIFEGLRLLRAQEKELAAVLGVQEVEVLGQTLTTILQYLERSNEG